MDLKISRITYENGYLELWLSDGRGDDSMGIIKFHADIDCWRDSLQEAINAGNSLDLTLDQGLEIELPQAPEEKKQVEKPKPDWNPLQMLRAYGPESSLPPHSHILFVDQAEKVLLKAYIGAEPVCTPQLPVRCFMHEDDLIQLMIDYYEGKIRYPDLEEEEDIVEDDVDARLYNAFNIIDTIAVEFVDRLFPTRNDSLPTTRFGKHLYRQRQLKMKAALRNACRSVLEGEYDGED